MARMLRLALPFLVPVCCMMAQTPPSSHNLVVVLPPGIPSETVQVTSALGGTFGSYGQTVSPPANKTVYSIPTSVYGLPAEGIQMVLWAPGCETRTHSLDLRKTVGRRVTYECLPHPALTLTGRIIPFKATRAQTAEVAIFYSASWECAFFGWIDCMVPQIPVARITPRSDGTFAAQLPDFASDPVVATWDKPQGARGTFNMFLRDPNTWNHIAELQPELEDYRSPDGSLKSASAYPSDLVFVPRFMLK